jgi:hypothetical protein
MRRLAFIAILICAAVPSAASAAACSPLDCAPSQFTLAHGTLLATRGAPDKPVRVIDLRTGATRWRLPAGIVEGTTLIHQEGPQLTWYDLATGARVRQTALAADGAFELVGGSQDGSRAVLALTERKTQTTFAVVSPQGERLVVVDGSGWSFDALRGSRLFLIHTLSRGYEVRLFDLAANRLRTVPLKDPDGSSVIWGAPFARLASPDGRYLFTLYLGSDGGAMIHELDLQDATARCVDLPGDGNYGSAITYALALDPAGTTLWAVSPGYGRAVAIDVRAHRVTQLIKFVPGAWTQNAGTAAFSPDGSRIVVTDAQHLWFVDPALRRVVPGAPHVAIALGWSPDGRKLWVVGERSRVSALAGD